MSLAGLHLLKLRIMNANEVLGMPTKNDSYSTHLLWCGRTCQLLTTITQYIFILYSILYAFTYNLILSLFKCVSMLSFLCENAIIIMVIAVLFFY